MASVRSGRRLSGGREGDLGVSRGLGHGGAGSGGGLLRQGGVLRRCLAAGALGGLLRLGGCLGDQVLEGLLRLCGGARPRPLRLFDRFRGEGRAVWAVVNELSIRVEASLIRL